MIRWEIKRSEDVGGRQWEKAKKASCMGWYGFVIRRDWKKLVKDIVKCRNHKWGYRHNMK